MIRTKRFLSALFFCLSVALTAQTSSFSRSGNLFEYGGEGKKVRLEFCTAKMFRVQTSFNGTFKADEPYMVNQYNWKDVALDIDDQSDIYLITTDYITVEVNKSDLAITVKDKAGKVLNQDADGAFKNEDKSGVAKSLKADEHFFGFGERMDVLDRRGRKVHLNVGRGEGKPHIIGAYNVLEANYAPVPFFMSTLGYGIFYHTSYASDWDMGSSNKETYSFSSDDSEVDYYFIYGPDFYSVLDEYTDLTGKSPLLPRFAHGLHVGTYSGGTWGHEEETSTHYVVELVRKYREAGIPIDILHLDSTWRLFGKNGGSGATSFEWRPTFKKPEAMFDTLYDLDLNMVGLHVRPRFDNGNKLDLLDQARAQGYVYPEQDNPGEFVNFFDEEATDWWWENGVMRIADMGAMFLKTDEGSAFGRKANESNKVGPKGQEIKALHNVFPVAYTKAPFTRFAKHNNMRGMNHTREGYAGIQRYPFIWAGDWPSEWQYFAPVIKAGLNIGASGVGYWTHNMGGFEHKADPELFARWVQFGMFSPVAHVFGMDHPGYKEPWNYGDEAEAIFKKYDRLRYQMIPYIYTAAYEQSISGKPIMKALVLAYQNDYNTYSVEDEYLFGNDLLICPVTTKDAKTRVVYLPQGTWYDYFTGEKYEGEKHYNIVTPLDKLPIFVKEGAILPMQDVVQFDDRKAYGKITLEVFPGTSEGMLYEDDGISEAYKENEFAQTVFESKNGWVKAAKATGAYKVPERIYAFKVHTNEKPETVSVTKNGKKIKVKELSGEAENTWNFNEEDGLLWVYVSKKAKDEVEVNY